MNKLKYVVAVVWAMFIVIYIIAALVHLSFDLLKWTGVTGC